MKRIDIVLGVIYSTARDKVLAARRPQGSHLGGMWEFPGGKVGSDETALQALKRELFEEVNIDVRDCSPLISFDYDYPDKPLRFSVWKVHGWTGQLQGKQGQQTQWVDIPSLNAADFPPANKGIITACKLPAVYLITPDLDSYAPAFMNELRQYLAAGVKLVQFRSKSANNHKPAVMEMIDACRRHGAELIVNSTPEFALEAGADGVHLTAERLLKLTGRPLPAGSRVAASCHNMRELMHAVQIDADFCVLSPVREKGSAAAGGDGGQAANCADNTLGWDGFSEQVRQIPVPVYALGGMRLADLAHAAARGAQGIALISDVWGRSDSAAGIKDALIKSVQDLSEHAQIGRIADLHNLLPPCGELQGSSE